MKIRLLEPGYRLLWHRLLPRSVHSSVFIATLKAWQPALNLFQCRTLQGLILCSAN